MHIKNTKESLTGVFLRYNFLWTVIILLSLFLRLYGLDLNPVGLSHDDELNEIINAKSLALTGLHTPGKIAGIFTQDDQCTGNCVYGELGSYILIPWMWVFPLSLFWSKIPFVLASLGIVYFTGKLFENLSDNPKIGLLTGLAVAINPWAIHFGRTAYLTTFSYLFYILGAYLFTRRKFFKSNLILGALSSIIGSLFYFGTKPILPFIIIWGITYNSLSLKLRYIKFTLIFILVISLLIGTYFAILSNSYAGRRLKEITNSSPVAVKEKVDNQRLVSLEIPLLRDLVINKYIVETSMRIEKYVGFFYPTFLFLKSTGDTDIYYDSNHGYYYLIDLPFLIFGIMALSGNFKRGIFVLSLILLSVIPAAVKTTGDTVYALRTALAYPLISGIIAWGIYYFYKNIPVFKRLFIVLIISGYIFSLSYFLIMYWYRTPIDKAVGWYHHKRILVNYVTRLKQKTGQKVIVVTAQPADTFNTYVFFSGLYNNKNNILEINKAYRSPDYQYKEIKFINNCEDVTGQNLKEDVVFIELTVKCAINQKNTAKIANPRDGGGMYNIINETLCTQIPKNRYPYPRSIYDFKVENFSDEDFCRTWIINPDQET